MSSGTIDGLFYFGIFNFQIIKDWNIGDEFMYIPNNDKENQPY